MKSRWEVVKKWREEEVVKEEGDRWSKKERRNACRGKRKEGEGSIEGGRNRR